MDLVGRGVGWGEEAELRDLALISVLHPLPHSTSEPVAAIFILVLTVADGPFSLRDQLL